MPQGVIRVGVAGWDYPDWEGAVYPSPSPKGFDRLAFLASFLDLVEINVTFYRQPDPASAQSWVRRVAGQRDFRFTAKLCRTFTHPSWGTGRTGSQESVDLRAEADRYREGIDPIAGAGLLGAVLAQFPQSFHDRDENRQHLEKLRALLPELPLVAEFRHRSWDHDGALRFLHQLGVGFCNLDQPALGATLRPTGHVTSRIAYIRLHGRNAENWFRDGVPVASRYDYLYSAEELRPWVERAERIRDRAEEIFIVANNHYRGKGPANALMFRAALSRKRVKAPASLVAAHPALKAMTTPQSSPPQQPRLFD